MAVLVDLVDDAAVAGAKPGVVRWCLDELDSGPDRNTRAKPGCEKSCALSIHEPITISVSQVDAFNLRYEMRVGGLGHAVDEVAPGRRIAPNSTA